MLPRKTPAMLWRVARLLMAKKLTPQRLKLVGQALDAPARPWLRDQRARTRQPQETTMATPSSASSTPTPRWGVLFNDRIAPLSAPYATTGELIEHGIPALRADLPTPRCRWRA